LGRTGRRTGTTSSLARVLLVRGTGDEKTGDATVTSRCLVRGLLVLWMWNITSTADGYELFTHARISQQAFDASAALQVYLGDVGIDPDKKFDPDDKAAASTAFTIFTNSGSVRDWLGAGAIREDDYLRSPFREALGCTPAQNPQDPNEDVNRPLNHF